MATKASFINFLIPESNSFNYVPLAQRGGKVWHQGPFWFMINAELLTLASGFVGGSAGLSFWWSLLAIVIGVLFGTIFVAFHGNQGPTVGLPQMVQSRAQFGTRGLVVPSAMVVFLYVGFTVFDVLLVVPAIQQLWPVPTFPLAVVVVVLTWAVALIGHDFLHGVERWLSYITVVVFGLLTVSAAVHGVAASGVPAPAFALKPFALQLSVSAAYALGFAIYVSDYTRYLPTSASAGRLIGWVYIGNAAGMIWFMGLGALLFAQFPKADGVIPTVLASGNALFGGFGTIVLLVSIPGLIMVQAVNMYGSTLTTAGAVDAFKRLRATLGLRVWILSITCLAVFLLSLYLPSSFMAAYGNYVTILLYFLAPWTAINLTDFYFVRHGHYAIGDLFARDGGRYGQWRASGLFAYAIGFCAMIPLWNNAYYVGPIGQLLGADLSFIVGIPFAALVYWALSRRIDPEEERRVAQRQIRAFEHADRASVER